MDDWLKFQYLFWIAKPCALHKVAGGWQDGMSKAYLWI